MEKDIYRKQPVDERHTYLPKEYLPELRTEITVDCGGTARYSGSAYKVG